MDLPRRILVVDDDDDAIRAIRSQLMVYDFEVDDLKDPTKVIPHLHNTNDYGLYIIDVNMPGKDGITLATQIRSTFRSTTPILFISGDINNETANRICRLKLSGHVEFLRKGEFNSKELFNECMGMLKEHVTSRTMSEMRGRLSHLQENFGEGMTKITEFMAGIQSQPFVTEAHCDKKAAAIVKAVRKEVIGIAVSSAGKKIDAALKPEILDQKVVAALKPAVVFDKARAAPAAKAYQWAFGIIFLGLLAWWGVTWVKAEHADDRTRLLEEKHKQIMTSVQHIGSFLSTRVTTTP